jgi:hypothetical protein
MPKMTADDARRRLAEAIATLQELQTLNGQGELRLERFLSPIVILKGRCC